MYSYHLKSPLICVYSLSILEERYAKVASSSLRLLTQLKDVLYIPIPYFQIHYISIFYE